MSPVVVVACLEKVMSFKHVENLQLFGALNPLCCENNSSFLGVLIRTSLPDASCYHAAFPGTFQPGDLPTKLSLSLSCL